jgi:hypothetical protein
LVAAYETQGKSDDWYTPRYIFDALGEQFDLDVAAPSGGPRHVPAAEYYSANSLAFEWAGFVWMNPPFGHQSTKRKWLRRFFDHGNGIALVPDRTSAPWFQEFAPLSGAMLFVAPGESPGTGTVLLAAGERAIAALCRATSLGFVSMPTQRTEPNS